jgi:predicted Zn finger-like uncharacterized protein
MGGNLETEVAQNLRAEPVAQADIFEPDQSSAPFDAAHRGRPETVPESLNPAAAVPTDRLCVDYGFRFVNGRSVAFGHLHYGDSLMHIICPHCTTFYGIDSSALGKEGRTVRCSRCKEVWLARSDDMAWSEHALMPMTTLAGTASDSNRAVEREASEPRPDEMPLVESPSITGDWVAAKADKDSWQNGENGWPLMALDAAQDAETIRPPRPSRMRRKPSFSIPRLGRLANLPAACATMSALVLALMIWRVDVVRLLPQTAAFYKMVGLDVNLRGLAFKDVKIATETVEGKPVLVIEGMIVDEARKPVPLPRLRFSVRDAQGAEIYAWNAVLEQSTLNPGEKAWFRSRLASPPADGRNIDVRFFTKRDVAAAGA